MRKHKLLWTCLCLMFAAIPALLFADGMETRMSGVYFRQAPYNYGVFPEISAPSGDPVTNQGWLYVKDNSGTSALYFEDDGGTVTALAPHSETVTATNAIAASECGKIFFLNSATEFASTLPTAGDCPSGCWFKFVVVGAPSGASYTVVTGNTLENTMYGGFVERETDTGDDGPYQAAGDTITIVDGVAVQGDFIDIVSDGTSWYVSGVANADGGLTITQAD